MSGRDNPFAPPDTADSVRVNPFGLPQPDIPALPQRANPFSAPTASTAISASPSDGPDFDMFAPPPAPAELTVIDAGHAATRPTDGDTTATMGLESTIVEHATTVKPTVAPKSARQPMLDLFEDDMASPLVVTEHEHVSDISGDNSVKQSARIQTQNSNPPQLAMPEADRRDSKDGVIAVELADARAISRKLEAERDLLMQQLRNLECKIDNAESNPDSAGIESPISPERAIELATKGHLRFEHLRSLSDKAALLDAAIICGRGDVLAVTCTFVANTLRADVFFRLLRERPSAARQHAATLRRKSDWDGLIALYAGLEWAPQAAQAEFERAIAEPDAKQQVRLLERCLARVKRCEVRGGDTRAALRGISSRHIEANITLLKAQHGLDLEDRGAISPAFTRWPKKRGTLQTPALTTLWYGWLYHYDDATHKGHPTRLRTVLGEPISESQLLWTGVRARAKAGDWESIDAILTRKAKFFGAAKLKPAISPAGISSVLVSSRAPTAVVKKYAMLVDDPQVRWKLLAAAGLHLEAVKALIEIRDPDLLESYYTKPGVVGDSHVRQIAFDALQKWGHSPG